MKNNSQITVLGAGVTGLTTGIVLSEHGYDVQIITKELPHETTSAVAAAIWFPYEAFPEDKVVKWSSESFQVFKQMANVPETGVSFIPFTSYLDTHEEPWWLETLPAAHILNDWEESPVNPNHRGYKMSVPLIETPIYLDYLLRRFLVSGGEVSQQEIKSLNELDSNRFTINCTGLGARYLFDDKHVYPIQGQIVKVEPSEGVWGMATEYPMGELGDEMAYVIPRRDCVVLGGTARRHEFSITPDEKTSVKIIKHCSSFQPQIEELKVLETKVGLRPGRNEVRLEKDSDLPVIHNYGHGGAGYTISWGCAQEVLSLI